MLHTHAQYSFYVCATTASSYATELLWLQPLRNPTLRQPFITHGRRPDFARCKHHVTRVHTRRICHRAMHSILFMFAQLTHRPMLLSCFDAWPLRNPTLHQPFVIHGRCPDFARYEPHFVRIHIRRICHRVVSRCKHAPLPSYVIRLPLIPS